MWFTNLFNQLLQVGVGPVRAADDLLLYRALLALLLLLFILNIVSVARSILIVRSRSSRGQKIALSNIITQPVNVVIEVLGVFGLWWMLTTPPETLPFVSAPSLSVVWYFRLSALDVYHVAGTIAHGLVSVLALSIVIQPVVWPFAEITIRGILRRALTNDDLSRILGFWIWIALLIAVGSWDLLRWPSWLVVSGELYVAFFLPFRLMNEVRHHTAASKRYHNPGQLTRRENIEDAIDFTISCIAIVLVMVVHQTTWFPLTFYGLYLAMTFVDHIVTALIHIRKPLDEETSLSRWEVTVPLVLILAWLGAIGLFRMFIANAYITPQLWLELAATVGAYVLFRPLITHAQHVTKEREQQQERGLMPIWVQHMMAATYDWLNPAVESLTGLYDFAKATRAEADWKPGEATTGLLQPPVPIVIEATVTREPDHGESIRTSGGVLLENPPQTAHPPSSLPIAPSKSPLSLRDVFIGDRTEPTHVSSKLQYRTFSIFLLAGIAYHYLLPSITPLLNNHLSLLVFSLLPLLAGLLPVLNKSELDAPRYVLLLLIYVILVTTGIDALLVVTNVGLILPPIHRDIVATLTDSLFNETALRYVAQELLVLITFGQILYLFQLIKLTLNLDQQQAGNHDPGGWVSFAIRLAAIGEQQRALEALDRVLAGHPNNPAALAQKARILYRDKRLKEALDVCDHALRSSHNDPNWHNFRGDILAALQRSNDAYVAYRYAVHLDPDNAWYWFDVANTLSSLGRYGEAVDAYETLLSLAPKEAPVWRNMAAILTQELGRHEQALVVVEQALKLERDSIRAWTIKSHALKMLGRPVEAQEASERAILLMTKVQMDADNWALLADVYQDSSRYQDALDSIDRAIELNSDVASYHQTKGEVLLDMGKPQEALIEINMAAGMAPTTDESSFSIDYFSVLRSKAKVLRELGRDADAVDVEREMAALSS